jgi:hypothetical protein
MDIYGSVNGYRGGPDALACMELPSAFPEHSNSAVSASEGFQIVNTTIVNVDAILDSILTKLEVARIACLRMLLPCAMTRH